MKLKQTAQEILKERLTKRNQALNENQSDASERRKVPTNPLLELNDRDTTDMIEFHELYGVSHPDGNEHWFPKSVLRNADDWNDDIKPFIPAPNPLFSPDWDYVLDITEALAYNEVLMARGKPGTGKDSTIEWVCGTLNWPTIREDGMEGPDSTDLIGYTVPDGSGGYTEMRTPLWEFAEHGGVYVRSEPFACSASVNMAMQGLLESARIFKIPGHPDKHRGQFKAHEHFRLFMTTNVRGTGDDFDKYAATTVQDSSTLNRVSLFSDVDYQKPEEEQNILKKAYPDLSDELIKKMVQLGNLIRDGWDKGEIDMAWSVRQLLTWGERIIRDRDLVRGFKSCYYTALTDVEKGAVKQMWDSVKFDKYHI